MEQSFEVRVYDAKNTVYVCPTLQKANVRFNHYVRQNKHYVEMWCGNKLLKYNDPS